MNYNPKLIRDLVTEGPWADPYEWSYFSTIAASEWRLAKTLAKRVTDYLSGTKYAEFIRSCGPVEKAGEFLVKGYLDYYCDQPYDVDFTETDPYRPGFSIAGIKVDVHTRMLKFAKQAHDCGAMGASLNVDRFLVMVPELGLTRGAEVYVFCGFDVDTRAGLVFGWTPASVIAQIPLSSDSKHSAKCLKVTDLYTISSLLPYTKSLAV